uniref:Ribonuclease H protein At1g65750 family n=1 Tax=Cajanus cajan TaxID=3821 RepID=A0A151T094_CAJCA|nr:Putative ribonuclease H protein At1g65750 family [Cajanus cajan]
MRPLLQDIISPFQGSFLPGRGTKGNSILAQEVLHHVNRNTSKVGLVAIKVDLEKAYDRVNWEFLRQTLLDFRFPVRIINLIMWGVRETSLTILWNGSKLDHFHPSRGLRQGDPLSPYLFVLCMEKLSLQINHRVMKGEWLPITLSRGATLQAFCMESGLKINLGKSRFLCSKGVSHGRKEDLKVSLGICHTNNLGLYLGFRTPRGRVTSTEFNHLVTQIQGRLASRKGKLLKKVGRLCLAKSVLAAIPKYTMQLFWLPQNICDTIDRLCKALLWSTSGSTSWKEIIKPKSEGGLGMRDTRAANISLLGSLVWDLLQTTDKPWVQVLTHKYLQQGSILNHSPPPGASYVWRSINKAALALQASFGPRLGTGQSQFWYANWLGTGPLCQQVSFMDIHDSQLRLLEL